VEVLLDDGPPLDDDPLPPLAPDVLPEESRLTPSAGASGMGASAPFAFPSPPEPELPLLEPLPLLPLSAPESSSVGTSVAPSSDVQPDSKRAAQTATGRTAAFIQKLLKSATPRR
jgi:hypothetical protein